jgi:hypothetical protein
LSFNYSPDLVMLVDHATRMMTYMAGKKINKQIGACPGLWRYCARGAGVGKAGFEWSCKAGLLGYMWQLRSLAGVMPAEEVLLIVPDLPVVINV